MLSLHWTEAKMSDFNRFISYKSKFQLLKHEIAEKIHQAETQSAALEESLRINQMAKAKRKRGAGGTKSCLSEDASEVENRDEALSPEIGAEGFQHYS